MNAPFDDLIARADLRIEAGLRRPETYTDDERLIYELARALAGATRISERALASLPHIPSCTATLDGERCRKREGHRSPLHRVRTVFFDDSGRVVDQEQAPGRHEHEWTVGARTGGATRRRCRSCGAHRTQVEDAS